MQFGFLFYKIHPWLKTSKRFKGPLICCVIIKSLQTVIRTQLVCERRKTSKTMKKSSKENPRSFLGFFSTLPGITLMLCLWLSPVKFSYLNFPYFVRHPIEQADVPLLTKTFIKEVGFFISNPSWLKIDVRPSLRWAEAGWQMMICDYVNCPLCVMSVGVS